MKSFKNSSRKDEICLRLCVHLFFSDGHYFIRMTFSIESYEEAVWGREWCWYMQFDPLSKPTCSKKNNSLRRT